MKKNLIKLIVWFLIALSCKTLCDLDKFRWHKTWLSETFLDAWRVIEKPFALFPPIDMWHVLNGVIVFAPIAIGIYLFMRRFNCLWLWKKKKVYAGHDSSKWRWKLRTKFIYAGICFVTWLLFYQLFRFFFHYLFMFEQYRDWSVF